MAGGVLNFDFANQRWTGVLQRIAVCYFLASLLVLHTKVRTQVAVFFAVLLLYWAALVLLPVPGFGPGRMTPEGSLHTYIDQKVMAGHISKEFYGPGDSMGILSTLPAVCSLLLGVFAGHWLKPSRTPKAKTLGLLGGGAACLAVGYVWSLSFPIIKHIWTSTYVLWAGGWCLLLMAAFYWLIDVKAGAAGRSFSRSSARTPSSSTSDRRSSISTAWPISSSTALRNMPGSSPRSSSPSAPWRPNGSG